MLTRERIDQLFALRAAAKAEDDQVVEEFKRVYHFDPFGPEARYKDRRWLANAWGELREGRPALVAYEAADKELSATERSELAVMADCEDFDAPRLDMLLDCLEARQRRGTH